MMALGTPQRPIKWRKVAAKSVTNRPPGGGAFDDVTGRSFTWNSASYRQSTIVFNVAIDRIAIEFETFGDGYPHACSGWGMVSFSDFRGGEPKFTVNVGGKAGTLNISSPAPGHTNYMRINAIYGEVAE